MKHPAAVLLALASLAARPATAHPGAVADGRATCGTEYSTALTAYTIPDIREAWYLRRVSTCASPAFWSQFDVSKDGQEVYVAVISPDIERFEDELQFHAIWYGPGLVPDEENGLMEIPAVLPEGVAVDEALAKEGAGYMTHAVFDSCDFVDTNAVMMNWSDLIKGRCSEEFPFGEDFSDPLQQDATAISWWLYSFNHRAAKAGTYRLQTWLTSRDDATQTAQGKYEITLGPWTWSGYASDSTLNLAQSQGTSCACAVNAWDYKEVYLERLGDLPTDFEVAQLPGGSCAVGDDDAPASPCVTIPQEPYMMDGSAVEWSGLFELEAGRTYEWTFHAYYQGFDADPEYGYPDPGMFVYLVASDDVESVSSEANDILTGTVEAEEEAPSTIVAEGETLEVNKPTFIEFTDPEDEVSTTVLIKPDDASATLAIFTQHVPSEFMAHALRDAKTGDYVFPTSQTLYFDAGITNEATTTEATTTTTAPGADTTEDATTTGATDSSATSSATTTSATAGIVVTTAAAITSMATAGTTTDAAATDATTSAATTSGTTTTMTTADTSTAGPDVDEDTPSPTPKEIAADMGDGEKASKVDGVATNDDSNSASSFDFADSPRLTLLAGFALLAILC